MKNPTELLFLGHISSLNYLRRLPADNIKIDRSFVSEILHDETSQKLLASLIDLLINIGKTVTAEGIETIEQLEWLTQHGCHIGQGYYFSKPLDILSFDRKYFPRNSSSYKE